MLDQGDVFVVEHKVLQGRVQIVGLCESVACDRLVDDAVFGVALNTGKKKDSGHTTLQKNSILYISFLFSSDNEHQPDFTVN